MHAIRNLINQWTAEAEVCEQQIEAATNLGMEVALKSRAAWSRLHANELEIALLAVEREAAETRHFILEQTVGVN